METERGRERERDCVGIILTCVLYKSVVFDNFESGIPNKVCQAFTRRNALESTERIGFIMTSLTVYRGKAHNLTQTPETHFDIHQSSRGCIRYPTKTLEGHYNCTLCSPSIIPSLQVARCMLNPFKNTFGNASLQTKLCIFPLVSIGFFFSQSDH